MKLEFTGSVSGWWIAIFAVIGSLLIARWYWRETRNLSKPWSVLLPLLRAAAFALLLGMLAAPTIRYQRVDGTLGRIAWVLDRSKSMAIRDAGKEQSRIDQLRLSLHSENKPGGRSSVLDQIASIHHLQLYSTSGEKLWDSIRDGEELQASLWSAQEPSTTLGNALLGLLSENEGTGDSLDPSARAPWDAIVLLSDGQSNSGAAVEEVIRSNGKRVPIYTVGVGDRNEPVDVAVLEATFSSSVRSEDRLRGMLRIKETLPVGTAYRVGVDHEGNLIWSQDAVSQNRSIVEYSFDVPAGSLIERAQQLHSSRFEQRSVPLNLNGWVETDAVELTQDNNRMDSSAWGVVKQNSVLLLDPLGGWESRYLRNALDRDPAWRVNAFLGPNAFRTDFFPRTKQDLFDFDLLVMTVESAFRIPVEKQDWLRDYVAYTGAGVVVLDSVKGSSQTIPSWLQDLLPVETESSSVQSSVSIPVLPDDLTKKISNGGAATIQSLKLSPAGGLQPAFQFETDSVTNQALWSRLQPPHTYRLRGVKGGAEVMLEGIVGRNQTIPLIVTQRFGQGRVVYFASDESWRWRYGVSDLYHQRFWNQLAGWAMRPPFIVRGDRIAIDAGDRVVRYGESVAIRAKLLGEDGAPIGLDRVQAIVELGTQTLAVVELAVIENAEGYYEGQWMIPESGLIPAGDSLIPIDGECRIRLEPAGLPEESKQLATSVYVTRPADRELERLARNEMLLQQIASETGGAYLDVQQSEELVDRLSGYSNGKVLGVTVPLWQSFPWFFAILLLLATEWWLRKRVGLV
ncbi:hypothetical protein SH501x_002770 [Pirellulaceae bacterium SH501]